MTELQESAASTSTATPRNRCLVITAVLMAVALIVGIVTGVVLLNNREEPEPMPEWVDVQLVAINGSGRRGKTLMQVNNIVVHYVGNPGTSAQNNRDYFNQPTTTVSSHFVVGLDGEVLQCVPLSEVSSASNHRNSDTISIEVCHPDETGQYNEKTYRSVVRLCRWLCERYELEATDVIRHYDVTGKLCPLYYVEHPEAWEQFIQDVADCKG